MTQGGDADLFSSFLVIAAVVLFGLPVFHAIRSRDSLAIIGALLLTGLALAGAVFSGQIGGPEAGIGAWVAAYIAAVIADMTVGARHREADRRHRTRLNRKAPEQQKPSLTEWMNTPPGQARPAPPRRQEPLLPLPSISQRE